METEKLENVVRSVMTSNDTNKSGLKEATGRKIVINAEDSGHGGFGLSKKAIELAKQLGADFNTSDDIKRDDPVLVQVVQDLGKAANGSFANLKIVEIPSNVKWEIQEYDGAEWVSEKDKTWR